jgi:hypothetical protein
MILDLTRLIVIASEAKQSSGLQGLDCFVAIAPRNDDQDSTKHHHARAA